MQKFVFILLFMLAFLSMQGQTKQIDNLQKQQKILQEEIKNTNKLFLDVKKQTTTLLDRINLINKQISSRKEMISLHRNEILALEKEQQRLGEEIKRLDKELKQKQERYAQAAKRMQMSRQGNNDLFFILSGKSLGESLRRMQYLKDYSKWRKNQAEEIKTQNAELSIKKEKLTQSKNEKQRALTAIETEQQKLQQEENVRQHEMAEARGKQKELQKTLQNKQQQARKLDAQIEKLIAEEVARQEREAEARRLAAEAERRRKAEAAAAIARREEAARNKKTKAEKDEDVTRRVESKKAPKMEEPKIANASPTPTDESFNLSKNFSANKGKLPMPVTGASSIVSHFGINKHTDWNISTNSNGIDIQTQKNANIRAVFDGEVSKVFSFPGSNTCVIVRHGDYYTFYANVYDLYVKQGDKVKTGQALGKIYTDPDTGVSKMHFQLWQKTVKLNPAPWLKR